MSFIESSFSNETKNRILYTTEFNGFSLVEAHEVDNEDEVVYAYATSKGNNVLISTLDNGEGKISVYELDSSHYLLSSMYHAIVLKVFDKTCHILASVSVSKDCELFKIDSILLEHNLLILTDYLQDSNRNLQYLFDFSEGKVISSGYDSIELKNGKLYASYGLADGLLDFDGSFVLTADEEDKKIPFFKRIFKRNDKVVGRYI